MKCKHVQEALSNYLEGGLDPPERQALTEHLAQCTECADEARQMERMLAVFRERVPRHEPVLDLWAEFVPKLAEAQAEEKLGVLARLGLRWERFWGNVAYGAILFTQAVAINTQARMQKYLLADPFADHEEGRA